MQKFLVSYSHKRKTQEKIMVDFQKFGEGDGNRGNRYQIYPPEVNNNKTG